MDVMHLLLQRHARLAYIDQYVPSLQLNDMTYHTQTLTGEALREADCVLILTDHSDVDYAQVVQEARLVVDTRNATGHLPEAAHVWRLARPRAAGQAKRGAA